jgi:hypothetical protein
MANLYPVETLRRTAAKQELHIATPIAKLSRSVEILTADIENDEARTGVRDVWDPTYPVQAQSLRVRRDNLMETIASLQAAIEGTPKAA